MLSELTWENIAICYEIEPYGELGRGTIPDECAPDLTSKMVQIQPKLHQVRGCHDFETGVC